MSRYRGATRAALVARLKAAPGIWPVYSNPPVNMSADHILVGDIAFEEPVCKGEAGAFCTANIEVWSQTFSPVAVDIQADLIVPWLDGQPLEDGVRNFMPPAFIGEQPQSLPVEAGGPVFGRVLAFRFFVE